MPQPIANNILTTPISGSIERAAMSLAIEGQDRDYGNNYSGLDWYSSITPIDGKYVIISKSIGTGLPTHWVTADDTDAELLYTVNRLPAVANNLTFTDTGSALDYLASSDRYIVLRSMPNNSDADAVILEYQSNNLSSYPRTGTTIFDINGGGGDGALTNGVGFDGIQNVLTFDGVDDLIPFSFTTPLSTNEGSLEMVVERRGTTGNSFPFGGVAALTNRFYLRQASSTNYDAARGNPMSTATFGTLDANRYYHLVMTWTPTNLYTYKNGEAIGSNSYTNPGTDLSTAVLGRGSGAYVTMNLGTFKAYNKTLNLSEIKQNYFGGPIVTDGLVFNIDASNLVSYENGSTTTYSLTGSFTGTLINGTGYLSNNGGTWDFDGVNDYIGIPYSSTLAPTSAITFEAWAWKSNWVDSVNQRILSKTQSGGYHIGMNEGGFIPTGNIGIVCYYVGGYRSTYVTQSTVPSGWNHFVGTCDGRYLRFYINGVNVSTYDLGSTGTIYYAVNNSLLIGAEVGSGTGADGSYFNGKIANTRIYNRGLTAEEVAQNYNAQKQKYQL